MDRAELFQCYLNFVADTVRIQSMIPSTLEDVPRHFLDCPFTDVLDLQFLVDAVLRGDYLQSP